MYRLRGWLIMRKRRELGLSQCRLADKAGLNPKFISDLETGARNNPGINLFLPLVKALETTVEELVIKEEDNDRQ